MPCIPINVSRNGVAALSLQTKRLKRHSPKQLKMLIWLVFRIIMLQESQPIKNLWQRQGSCLPPILHHRPLDSEFHHWVATFIHRTGWAPLNLSFTFPAALPAPSSRQVTPRMGQSVSSCTQTAATTIRICPHNGIFSKTSLQVLFINLLRGKGKCALCFLLWSCAN